MSLALKVFSVATASALEVSSVSNDSAKDTAALIRLVVSLWKLLNCKRRTQSIMHNDPDFAVVDSTTAPAIDTLQKWANCEVLPKPAHKGNEKREKTLTKPTPHALSWTCNALISLSKHRLTTEEAYQRKYVCLGFFNQDCLERHFHHFRQSAGGNYYIPTREIFQNTQY